MDLVGLKLWVGEVDHRFETTKIVNLAQLGFIFHDLL